MSCAGILNLSLLGNGRGLLGFAWLLVTVGGWDSFAQDDPGASFREIVVQDASLPLLRLPFGNHVVTVIDWQSLVDGQLHAPRERRQLSRLSITEPVWLSQFEVSQDFYKAVVGRISSHLTTDVTGGRGLLEEFPAHFVAAEDALAFCERLTRLCWEQNLIPLEYAFRLPLREEWQLAAQEGRSSLYRDVLTQSATGGSGRGLVDDPLAIRRFAYNRSDVSTRLGARFDRPWKLGSKEPNLLGFFDLYGNVQEWTTDPSSREFYLVGGAWVDLPSAFWHSATFRPAPRDFRSKTTGFRIALARRHVAAPSVSEIPRSRYTHLHDYRVQYLPTEFAAWGNRSTVDLLLHPDGSIWVATQTYLQHYRGGAVSRYDDRHLQGLPDYAVTQVELDEQNRVWVLIERISQLACFDGTRFHAVPSDRFPGELKGLSRGRTGRLWGVTTGGSFFRLSGTPADPDGFEVVPYSPKDVGIEVKDIIEVAEDVLIVSGKSHRYYRLDLKAKERKEIWDAEVRVQRYLTQGPSGGAWLSNLDTIRAVDAMGRITHEAECPDIFALWNGWSFHSAGDQNLYLALPDLIRFSTRAGWSLYPSPVFEFNVKVQDVDPLGGLWVVGRRPNPGAWRISEGPIESLTERHGITTGSGWSTCSDRAGGVWLLTSSGVTRWTASGEMLRYDGDQNWLNRHGVDCVYADRQGRVWVSVHHPVRHLLPGMETGVGRSERSVLARLEGQRFQHFPLEFKRSETDRIFAITETSDGVMWFGSHRGLVRYREGEKSVMYTEAHGLPEVKIRVLHEDQAGTLWVGTHGAGLFSFDRTNERFVRYTVDQGLSGDFIWSVCEDKEGVLWFGTNHGLTRFREGAFTGVSPSAGFPSRAINQIFDDGRGNLWIGTMGICRVDKNELHQYCDGNRTTVDCFTYGVRMAWRWRKQMGNTGLPVRSFQMGRWFFLRQMVLRWFGQRSYFGRNHPYRSFFIRFEPTREVSAWIRANCRFARGWSRFPQGKARRSSFSLAPWTMFLPSHWNFAIGLVGCLTIGGLLVTRNPLW